MPERKLRNIREEKPTITLRRSPRLLHANRTVAKDPRTLKLETTKVRQGDLFLTPPGSLVTKSLQKCVRSLTDGSKVSAKSRKGSRRSAGLGGGADASENGTAMDLQKRYLMEKRVTRSSVRGNKNVDNRASECVSGEDSGEKVRVLRKEGKSEVGSNSSLRDRYLGRIEKRITRSSSQTIATEKVEKAKDASTKELDKNDGKKCCIQRGSGDESCPGKTQIGKKSKKRKRGQVGEEYELVQGWTKEQDLALRRAYFTAKPTPRFWKKVARMVPGKSAQECLDRIHSEQLTPQPRTRARTNRNEPSSFSFSASKLLSPTETKTKNLKQSKRKSLVTQKMVRQLLQKQQKVDEEYEADLFAILEPKMDSPSLNFAGSSAFSSPIPNLGSGVRTRFRETSSLAHKKHFSKFNSSAKTDFTSPPVLKQIKNKALHERYIDQLHGRDAKRKAASLRNARSIHGRSDKKSSHLKVNLVKVAKDALVFEAQDAINQFQSLQSSILHDDIDDNSCDTDEDEGEDEL